MNRSSMKMGVLVLGVVVLSVVVPVLASTSKFATDSKWYHGSNREFALAEYPPTEEFMGSMYEHGTYDLLLDDMFNCYHGILADVKYNALGYSIRDFYQCDLPRVWSTYNKNVIHMTWPRQSSRQEEMRRLSVESMAEEKLSRNGMRGVTLEQEEETTEQSNIEKCRMAQNAHVCMVSEMVEQCLYHEKLPYLRQLSSDLKQATEDIRAAKDEKLAEKAERKFKDTETRVQEMKKFLKYICDFRANKSDCNVRGQELGFGLRSPHVGRTDICEEIAQGKLE